MCRVSPFFPLATANLQKRDLLRDMVITQSSWGEVLYTGPRLSVYDEDVLSAILVLIDSIKTRQKTIIEGKKLYTYKVPLLPILRLLGYKKYGKSDYRRILDTLKLMTVAGLQISIFGKSKDIKRKVVSWYMSAMLWSCPYKTGPPPNLTVAF